MQDAGGKRQKLLLPLGVTLSWIDCPAPRCLRPERNDVFFRFVLEASDPERPLHIGTLGFIEDGYAGRGRITMLIRNILPAHAMAHDFSHLLGKLDHSHAGLMSPNWSPGCHRRMTPAALMLSRMGIARFRETVQLRTER